MTEIVVSPAPPKPEILTGELLEQQVTRDLNRVSNLLGFDRRQRESLTSTIHGNQVVQDAWADLHDASRRNGGTVPVWIRNKIVGSTCFRLLDDWLATSDNSPA